MAKGSYSARVVVLRKRKLSETDLILQLLKEDGSMVDAVAKGARKPTSKFATRCELFNECDLMLARGRNLDIVTEARLVSSRSRLHESARLLYASAPIADVVSRTAQPGLEVERLYDMVNAAFAHMAELEDDRRAPVLTAAYLVKHVSLLGMRPQLGRCVACGREVDPGRSAQVAFSLEDGGVLCSECSALRPCARFEGVAIAWCRALLGMTFDQALASGIDVETAFDVLQFENRWLRDQMGISSTALSQLFSSTLFA